MTCHKLQNLIYIDLEGNRHKGTRCSEMTAPTMGEIVVPEICELCPVREDVARRFAESRPAPIRLEDLHKEFEVRPEVVSAGWPECRTRQDFVITCCNGKKEVFKQCISAESVMAGQAVDPGTCRNCPVRASS